MKRFFSIFCLLGFGCLLLSSCNTRLGRRPQVMMSQSDSVIDYSDYLVEEELIEGVAQKENPNVSFSDQEKFDPYAPFADTYSMGKGDILGISVLGDEDTIVDNAVVAPDGKLYYTVIDGIPAAGRSVNEVSSDVCDQLKDIFLDPVVSISPNVIKGQSFTILGRVQSPGEYTIPSPMRLIDAIGDAGGILMNDVDKGGGSSQGLRRISTADLSRSFIVRDREKLDIDFEALVYHSDPSQNIFIRPGDYIYLAPTDLREVFVLGQVVDPLRVPYSKGLTLMNVLATAGGWTMGDPYSADMTKVVVIRGSLECPRVAVVDLKRILCGEARDIYMEPGDIVYVQSKQFRFLREVVRLAIENFVYSFSTSAGNHFARDHWFLRDRRLEEE